MEALYVSTGGFSTEATMLSFGVVPRRGFFFAGSDIAFVPLSVAPMFPRFTGCWPPVFADIFQAGTSLTDRDVVSVGSFCVVKDSDLIIAEGSVLEEGFEVGSDVVCIGAGGVRGRCCTGT